MPPPLRNNRARTWRVSVVILDEQDVARAGPDELAVKGRSSAIDFQWLERTFSRSAKPAIVGKFEGETSPPRPTPGDSCAFKRSTSWASAKSLDQWPNPSPRPPNCCVVTEGSP